MRDRAHEADMRPESFKRWGRWAFHTATLFALLPLFSTLTARWWWIGDLCCHFRVQYAVLLIPFLAIALWLREWKWLCVIVVIGGFNLALISPLFLPRPREVVTTPQLRLMTANVFVRNDNTRLLIDLIKDEQPDVVLTLEINDHWLSALDDLQNEYPYRIDSISDPRYPSYGAFGCALLSRLPLRDERIIRIGSQSLPVVMAEIESDGVELTVCGAHPYPPSGRERTIIRDEYLDELGRLLSTIRGPLVLLGDLNTTRWSPKFRTLAKTAEMRDASEGFGWQPTWPGWLPLPQIPIDHVLVSPELKVIDHRVGPSIDSDHLPVTTDIVIPPRQSGE